MSDDPHTDGGSIADTGVGSADTGVGSAGSPARPSPRLLFEAVFRKQLLLLVRYPLNTAARVVGLFLFFAVIFYGGQAVGGPAFDESLGGLIVGFFLFTMAIVSYAGLAWNVTREAQWGTLEQLYMSPYGFGRVMLTKALVNVLFSFLWGAIVLALMLGLTGERLALDLITLVPVILFGLASVVGLGFVFAGLALVYKRIENVFQLVQFALIGFIAAPTLEEPLLGLLPLVQGSDLLFVAMTDGVRLWEFPIGELAVLVATGVGYLVAGFLVLGACSERARRLGVLGHY